MGELYRIKRGDARARAQFNSKSAAGAAIRLHTAYAQSLKRGENGVNPAPGGAFYPVSRCRGPWPDFFPFNNALEALLSLEKGGVWPLPCFPGISRRLLEHLFTCPSVHAWRWMQQAGHWVVLIVRYEEIFWGPDTVSRPGSRRQKLANGMNKVGED